MNPLAHQIKFVKGYADKGLLVHEGGSGKSVCAALWLKDNRDSNALVVCPKKIINKWQKVLTEWGTKATTMSPNEFKKHPIAKWSSIVVDEADEWASPLFVARDRSAMSAKLYEQVRAYPDTPIILLTATPIRSRPDNLHTLLCFLGIFIEYKIWRDRFFDLKRMPYLVRPAYIPKDNWRADIRTVLEKHADIVLLKDCVDLPPVFEETIMVKTTKFIKQPESILFFDEHRWEQQNKVKEVLEIGKQYRKVLVVAYYREQIEQLEKELAKDKPTFAVHGGTKNQESILDKAQEVDECYLIVQASLGAGFDADTFSSVVFVSMSYSVRDFVQMKYRVRRIHNLHPVKYTFLIGGRCDKAILTNVEAGKEFVPSEWND